MGHSEFEHKEQVSERFRRYSCSPVHQGAVEGAQGKALGVGSCGDTVEMTVRLEGSTIAAVGHIPTGCVYTVACADAVCALIEGKSMDEALLLSPEEVARELDGLPEDHLHCARLAVNTLGEAIADAYKSMLKSTIKDG
ncbi:MAG: iron-sulfur cluster assembly scaffold protein [Desulfobacteraceae bacterium]|nr:iron-sulfur cluster assembly scaffold protein [Desulfobacteraceae bacterium]